jgi:hypothetical protein
MEGENKKLIKMRVLLGEHNIDAFIIPHSDEHNVSVFKT